MRSTSQNFTTYKHKHKHLKDCCSAKALPASSPSVPLIPHTLSTISIETCVAEPPQIHGMSLLECMNLSRSRNNRCKHVPTCPDCSSITKCWIKYRLHSIQQCQETRLGYRLHHQAQFPKGRSMEIHEHCHHQHCQMLEHCHHQHCQMLVHQRNLHLA